MVRLIINTWYYNTDFYIFCADDEVGKIFTQISVSKGEAHIKLDEKDFYEKKMINLKKKWILDGLDPDEEEEKLLKKRVKRMKPEKKSKKTQDAL